MITEYKWAPPWCDAEYIISEESKGWKLEAQNNGYHVRAKESAKRGRPFRILLSRQVSPAPTAAVIKEFMAGNVKLVLLAGGANVNKGV